MNSFQTLLAKPLPPGVLKAIVEDQLKKPMPILNGFINEIAAKGGVLPDALIDYSRGQWLVWQFLSHSGSDKTVEDLIGEVAKESLLSDLPRRASQVLTGRLGAAPSENGFPLSNQELYRIIKSELGLCIDKLLKQYLYKK